MPTDGSQVAIDVRGRPLQATWSARQGADRKRTGMLKFGRRSGLDGLVAAGETLELRLGADGRISLR